MKVTTLLPNCKLSCHIPYTLLGCTCIDRLNLSERLFDQQDSVKERQLQLDSIEEREFSTTGDTSKCWPIPTGRTSTYSANVHASKARTWTLPLKDQHKARWSDSKLENSGNSTHADTASDVMLNVSV